ncbi:type VII secretion-associated serine protease mycosin [Streptomyces sp. NBC_00441]|uniref:type VII secretion-associated serine protease mycosin n=1 Tax=Streptomyces sp. NBC_00441 TaxID=2975742 RepID=UPI002E2B868E|nr:type VII secretion-associated serine protease mycosin [Streptomyces sp. NBC_00441]
MAAIRTVAALAALATLAVAQPARAATGPDGGACVLPANRRFEGRPWPLQRVLLDELWHDTRGEGVRVAVIDTGVDDTHPQLAGAVARGADTLEPGGDGTGDTVGHGTLVAGLIAARPRAGTGFVGLAPGATVIPVRQNDARDHGTDASLADAIRHAVARRAQVINISQETVRPQAPGSDLGRAVAEAVRQDIVVVASAGNNGADGSRTPTYPAAFDGVLAVAASDRDDERAPFSRPGSFVDVAAPGVDIVSTAPGRGHCADSGTSFAAPYVSAVAALMRAKYPRWTAAQIAARIEQTAERSVNGRDDFVGWGVVDPVRALSGDDAPQDAPHPDGPPPGARAPDPAPLSAADTPQRRDRRHAAWAMALTALLTGAVAGAAAVARELRRRRTG